MGLGVKRTFFRRVFLIMTVLSLIASRTSCTSFGKLNSLFPFAPHCWSTSYTFESYNDLSITTIALLLSALVTINFSSSTFLCKPLITPFTLLFIWGRGVLRTISAHFCWILQPGPIFMANPQPHSQGNHHFWKEEEG